MNRRRHKRHEPKGPLDEWQLPEGASQTTQALASLLRERSLLRRDRLLRPTKAQFAKFVAEAELDAERVLKLRSRFDCQEYHPNTDTEDLLRLVIWLVLCAAPILVLMFGDHLIAYALGYGAVILALFAAFYLGKHRSKRDESSRLFGLLAKSLKNDEARASASAEPPAPAILAPPQPVGDPTAPPFTRARRGSSS